MDSLEVRESLIPGAGVGLFSTKITPAGTILGEYKGYFCENPTKEESNYSYYFKDHALIGTNLFSKINDIVDFRELTATESRLLDQHQLPLLKDKIYNCKFIETRNGVFIKACKEILLNEELYIPYGNSYWEFRFLEKGYINEYWK